MGIEVFFKAGTRLRETCTRASIGLLERRIITILPAAVWRFPTRCRASTGLCKMIAYFSLYCANALPICLNRTVLNEQVRNAFARPCACGVTWPIMVGPHDHPSSRGCFHPRPRPRRVISFITADPRSLARIVSERGLHIHNIHEKFRRSIIEKIL